MVDPLTVTAVLFSLVGALALATQNLLIRLGTERGRVQTAALTVMVTNVVILAPPVFLLYYPDYGVTPFSVVSFVAAGVVGTMVGRLLNYTSIQRIGASRTAPIVASQALIATVFGVVLLGESLAPLHGVAVVLIVVGIGTIAWEMQADSPTDVSRQELWLGLLVPVAAAVAFAAEPVYVKYGLAEGTPAAVGLVIKTVCATGGYVLYLRWRGGLPRQFLAIGPERRWFVLAGICSSTFLLCYYVALAIAPANVVVPIVVTNTLFIVVLSALFMPSRLEQVTGRLVAAASAVVVGVVLITVYG